MKGLIIVVNMCLMVFNMLLLLLLFVNYIFLSTGFVSNMLVNRVEIPYLAVIALTTFVTFLC